MTSGSAGFVLVKWIDEDAWDVLPMKNSVAEVKNIDDVIGTVVDFFWKKGEESAPCTVLHYGKQKDMEKKFVGLTESSTSSDDAATPNLGVGRRTIKRPARLEESDDCAVTDGQEIGQQPKKKGKKSTTSAAIDHSILTQMGKNQSSAGKGTPSSCRCDKYSTLKSKYIALKKTKEDLSKQVDELLQYKELHSLVRGLRVVTTTLTTTESPTRTTTPIRRTTPPLEPRQLNVEVMPPMQVQPVDILIRPTSKIDIGNGVLLEKGRLLAVTQASSSATKLARNLFMVVFKRDEVVGRSITGKKSMLTCRPLNSRSS